ncbi:MAG: PEP-CTERM sorting domain-containing protein [Cyanobacteria bacterium P01_D01_bin.14]
MAQRANGNLIVGGFSAPAGIYEYDPSGNQVAVYDGDDGIAFRGIRGVYELGNGNILWTGGDGVISTELATGIATDIYTVNTPELLPEGVTRPGARYIDKLSIADAEAVPEPATLMGLLAVGALGIARRRQSA